jgi:uncharacterized protein YkwD
LVIAGTADCSDVPIRPRYVLGVVLLAVAAAAQLAVAPHWLALERRWSKPVQHGDAWAAYLAPTKDCPGSEHHDASSHAQERTMLCLVNWARVHHGLDPLRPAPALMRGARLKARDMTRCNEFRHRACGRPASAAAREAGYPIRAPGVRFGENIAWGPSATASPRVIMDGWLHSGGHRRNLLRALWTEQGIARRSAAFQGERDAVIWVSQLGTRRAAR